ncbi:MAG TPA: anti-sigma factor [Roseiflexaceae bacterium]|nr:anti-sigma factor [Roseiflexaceae bacterium]
MTTLRRWRGRITALAAAALVAALLALPPVQAAADQLLKIFRVQAVVFVPVSEDRMRELEQLNFDESTLFVSEPALVNDPGEPQVAAGAAEAARLAGLGVLAEPAFAEPPATAEYQVRGRSALQFQVNVDSARQLLLLAGVDDVTLPDELGREPITADLPATVTATYRGPTYDLTLIQGSSPQVTVPEGVELEQLGVALLRLLGTPRDQAEALGRQIDWSTTFVFPFPADMDGVQTVDLGGATGLLVTARDGDGRHRHLYWQRGDRFFVLEARGGIDQSAFLAIAESIR